MTCWSGDIWGILHELIPPKTEDQARILQKDEVKVGGKHHHKKKKHKHVVDDVDAKKQAELQRKRNEHKSKQRFRPLCLLHQDDQHAFHVPITLHQNHLKTLY